MVWFLGKKAVCEKIPNSLCYFKTQFLRLGEGNSWGNKLVSWQSLESYPSAWFGTRVLREVLSRPVLSWGGTKGVDFRGNHFFFFLLQMIFTYSHIEVGLTLLINLFSSSWRYWRGRTKALLNFECALGAVSECLLWLLLTS